MKRTFYHLYKKYPNFILLGLIFCLTFSGILAFVAHYSRAIETVDWKIHVDEQNGWEFYHYHDSKKVGLQVHDQVLDVKHSIDYIYQQRTITETIENPILLIELSENFHQIFLDDQLLYTNEIPYQFTEDEFHPPFLLTLPQNIVGKTIIISFPYEKGIQNKPIIVDLMSYLNFTTMTIDYTISRLLPIIAFFLIAFFVFGMFLYRLYRKSFDISILLLSLTALLFMCFLATSYFEVFFISSGHRYYKYIFYVLYPIPLSYFFYLRMHSTKKIYLPIIVTHTVLAAIYLLFHSLNLSSEYLVQSYTFVSSLVSIYTFAMMLIEAKNKNQFFIVSLKILFVSMLSIYGLFSLIHIMNYPFSLELFDKFVHLYSELNLRYVKDTLSLAFMIIVFMVSLFDYLSHMIRRNVTIQALTMKNELAVKSYQLMETNILKTRALKHDLKHHIAVLRAYSQNHAYEKVNAYLTSLIDEQQLIPTISYTENFLVNAILTSRLEEAKNSGIFVEHEVYTPAHIMLNETDLCSLLMNMLDNAIEACQRIPVGEDRWIKIKIQKKDLFLIISCQNSFHESVEFSNNSYISSKEDKKNHGFGIKTMEIIAEKYHSILSIHYSQQVFTLKTNLKLPTNLDELK